MWALALWDSGIVPLQWGVVIGASLAAAFSDVRTRRIPNALTLPLLAGGLVTAFAVGGASALADSCAAAVILGTPYLLLFLRGGGGGDVKLMAALGAWLGVVNGLAVLAAVAVSGIVLAFGWIWANRGVRLQEMRAMPFGVAISLGVGVAATGMLLLRL